MLRGAGEGNGKKREGGREEEGREGKVEGEREEGEGGGEREGRGRGELVRALLGITGNDGERMER